MLTAGVLLLTRQMNSSISFGLLPAEVIRVGWDMSVGIRSPFRLNHQ
jgi:hypothetical protein